MNLLSLFLSPQHIPLFFIFFFFFFLFFFFLLQCYLYMIIIFCKKSVHSLALTNTHDNGTPSAAAAASFRPTTAAASTVDDDIHSGYIDEEVGGNFDGLTSCTESVGYESSVELDERSRRKSKKFPPTISSLTQNGKPTFFLRPVRKDGRLKLRQVRSNRPETLLASRKDGRLRMHLIYSPENCEQDDEAEDAVTEEGRNRGLWPYFSSPPPDIESGGGSGV